MNFILNLDYHSTYEYIQRQRIWLFLLVLWVTVAC